MVTSRIVSEPDGKDLNIKFRRGQEHDVPTTAFVIQYYLPAYSQSAAIHRLENRLTLTVILSAMAFPVGRIITC